MGIYRLKHFQILVMQGIRNTENPLIVGGNLVTWRSKKA